MKLSPRVLALVAFIAAACGGGDGGTGPVVPAALAPVSSVNLSATVGTMVADSVSVRVLDTNNKAMANVQVSWAVTSGGGSVNATATATNAQGTAKVAWILGTTVGENKLTATVSGLSPVVFTATASAGAPASMTVVAGADQVAVVGTAVPTPPAVVLKDAHGNPVAGRNVSFVATAGGGVASGGAQTTNAAGEATVGGWTLGPTAGTQTLLVSAGSVTPARINATALAGAPAQMAISGGNAQRVAAGSAVPTAPAVVVKDEFGNLVAGAAVTFAVTRGGGSVTGAAATSDANGVARVGSWTLGDAGGLNVLEASSGVGSASFFANARSQPRAGFNIDLHFTTLPKDSYIDAVDQAVAKWQAVITGELSNVTGSINSGQNGCGANLNETVDDMLIVIAFVHIDGVGKTLGRAGPCVIRTSNNLPVFGLLELDTADIQLIENLGVVKPVFQHEIGHVLGIGTLWCIFPNVDPNLACKEVELLDGRGEGDPFFLGTNAQAAFTEVGGAVFTGDIVPVAGLSSGPGSAFGHWRESVMDTELMTPEIDAGSNPMSLVTIRSLQDIGYAVDRNEAEAYTVPVPGATGSAAAALVQGFKLREANHTIPLYRVDADGTMHRIR